MKCHSERSEESPHFIRDATLYTLGENALRLAWDGTSNINDELD
jgi:hypothetical protein